MFKKMHAFSVVMLASVPASPITYTWDDLFRSLDRLGQLPYHMVDGFAYVVDDVSSQIKSVEERIEQTEERIAAEQKRLEEYKKRLVDLKKKEKHETSVKQYSVKKEVVQDGAVLEITIEHPDLNPDDVSVEVTLKKSDERDKRLKISITPKHYEAKKKAKDETSKHSYAHTEKRSFSTYQQNGVVRRQEEGYKVEQDDEKINVTVFLPRKVGELKEENIRFSKGKLLVALPVRKSKDTSIKVSSSDQSKMVSQSSLLALSK